MNRMEAIEEVENWYTRTLYDSTEEESDILYEVYCEKLEAIDDLCVGYGNFEDVPDLDSDVQAMTSKQ